MLFPGGMSGLDLAREVERHWPDLPVLLATSDPADAAEGGFPVLRKPYATLELTRAVTALVRRIRPVMTHGMPSTRLVCDAESGTR